MVDENKSGRIDDAAFYHSVRSRLEHEDSLIVSRLAWLMASESFLFTAYAIVLNGLATPGMQAALDQHHRLIRLIPLVGIASSVLIFAGVVAAIRAIAWLRSLLRARVPDETILGLPPISTPASVMLLGLAAPLILPLVFVTVWLYLLATHGR